MTNTALVLVDIQNEYFPGGKVELEGPLEAAGQAARLLVHFRATGQRVVHVQHIAVRPGSKVFLPGTPAIEIHATVAPLASEAVLQKNFPNSFRQTGLYDLLKATGVERLVICGMMTHMCIDATSRAAVDLGFDCRVAADACATRPLTFGGRSIAAADVHGAFLATLAGNYARVLTVDELLAELATA